MLTSDRKALSSTLEYSEYYLCFISPEVYEEYFEIGGGELFISLLEYNDYQGIEYYSDNAIRLSSTGATDLPGLALLPEDTLICIRCPNFLAAKSDKHLAHFNNAKKMLENILELKNS